jgi:hypothetical protein
MMLPLKRLSDHKYSLHKGTQFSQVNNVLDPPTSVIDCVLTRVTVLLKFIEWSYFAQR